MMKHVSAAIALLITPVGIVSGCSNQASNNPSTSTTSPPAGSASSAQKLGTQLNAPDGTKVADATVDFTDGYATVTVQTAATGVVSPGFHGLHIHAVGRCEPNSAAPSGGQTADFASAGERFQAPGHTGQPASGDLPPLLVRSDGSGKLVATSDGFTLDQLKSPEGSSIVLDQGADIGSPTPESDKHIACGVLSPASVTTTTSTPVSTSVSTSTITTTAASPAPPATVTVTPSTTVPTTTVTGTTSTSTSTVTVIQPTLPPITVPGPPGPGG